MKNKIVTLLLTCGFCLTPALVHAAGPGDIVFSQCDNYVAMRGNPDSESAIVGRLYNLSAATVLDESEGWYEVTSGEICGWVDSSYFIEGAEAESMALQQGYQVAKPHVEAINIRTAPNEDADIVDVGSSDNQLVVENYDGGEWVEVSDNDGDTGYVKADYVEISNRYTVAVAEDLCEDVTPSEPEFVPEEEATTKEVEEEYTPETETEAYYLPEEEASFANYAEQEMVENTTYLGTYTLTAYCGCSECTGGLGVTAAGNTPVEGWTVACNSLPFGTQISINGTIYEVQDTGNMGDNVIDIYMESHEAALAFGTQTADVYLVSYGYDSSSSYTEEETEAYTAEITPTYAETPQESYDIGDGYVYDTTTDTVTDTNTGTVYDSNSDIVSYARQFVGVTPYVWGGNSYTDGMDCSHFVWNVLKDTGAYDGGYVTSDGFLGLGTPVDGLENAQAGDVIVYNGHVAIYDGEGGIIEAQGSAYGTTNNRSADSSTILGIRRF